MITRDVLKLSRFYQDVRGAEPEGDDVFVALSAEGAKLSIFAEHETEMMAPGCMHAAGNGACALQFEVKTSTRNVHGSRR
jgi:hypothetical protein